MTEAACQSLFVLGVAVSCKWCGVCFVAGGDKLKEGLPEDVLDNLHTVFCGNRLCLAIPSAVEILVAYFSPLQRVDEN